MNKNEWNSILSKNILRILVTLFIIGASMIMGLSVRAGVTKLSGTMPDVGKVKDFKISPDGNYVVYWADQDTDESYELYSVNLNGGAIVRLNHYLPAGSSVSDDYKISSDGNFVVYTAPQDKTGVIELYSVPIMGPASEIMKLNKPLVAGGNVFEFQTSSGDNVVYRADQDVDTIIELYNVPIRGPASSGVKLNLDLGPLEGDVSTDFIISTDGSRVVYRANQQDVDTYELFSVPIDGPAGESVKLNGPLVLDGDVLWDEFIISPDNKRVVYRANQVNAEQTELFSVSIEGPASEGIKLNGPLVEGGGVFAEFMISWDSKWVVYRADQLVDETAEMFSVPITGTWAIKLNSVLPSNGDVHLGFQISPDSNHVIYRADQETNDVIELFSVPIRGPASEGVKLNRTLTNGGNVPTGYIISLDSEFVVYRADQENDGVFELYSVPILGPPDEGVKLNKSLIKYGNVWPGLLVSPDNQRVIYRADQEVDGVAELYSVPISGPSGAGVKLNEPIIVEGDVLPYVGITPDSKRAIFRADQKIDAVVELFAADILTFVQFEHASYLVGEDVGVFSYPVELLNATSLISVTVDYAVTGGTALGGGIDYILNNGNLTFQPGNTRQFIDIIITDDQIEEFTETILITLDNPHNAELSAFSTLELLITDEIFTFFYPLVRQCYLVSDNSLAVIIIGE